MGLRRRPRGQAGGPGNDERAMPQLEFQDYAPQLVWLAISFTILYLLMAKLALPKIGRALARRQQKLEGDLARAEKLKAEAEAVLAAYQKAMADAKAQAQAELQKTAAELARAAAEREAALGAELGRRAAEAERRIQAAKTAALADTRGIAAGLAQDLARKLAGVELSPAAAEAAVARAEKERR
jgi:F-type H+-transporting ATPase subunit b